METRKVILELSCELVDKIDRLNTIGDRSDFISHLLEEQLKTEFSKVNKTQMELMTKTGPDQGLFGISGEINLVTSKGESLGKFDIDTLEGFEGLTKKIQEISKDPAVQIRASTLF